MLDQSVTYPAALAAGLTSFLSPCILPLVPAYFSFISGYSFDELTGDQPSGLRRKVVESTVAFGLGFTLINILLGASASLLGGLIMRYNFLIRIGGGLVIIILGFHLIGLLRIRFLEMEKRLHLRKKPTHILGTVLVGMAFAAGWSPCIGPILSAILFLAAVEETVLEGVMLLSVYSFGLWVPFLLMSLFINQMLVILHKTKRALKFVNVATGVMLIGLGMALIFDRFGMLWSLVVPAGA
ncbi:MAG: cytochrome c biogenesis protein CcdA [Desulfobacterales bacterium]|nr:cytochrome c biogenesis protein CcdA [Desulfobacterales bacterium]MDJ0883342.1 cytochrome c biogenesis protein CcdA [Desulfobacterales bacterium]